jgi:hypothetical protein
MYMLIFVLFVILIFVNYLYFADKKYCKFLEKVRESYLNKIAETEKIISNIEEKIKEIEEKIELNIESTIGLENRYLEKVKETEKIILNIEEKIKKIEEKNEFNLENMYDTINTNSIKVQNWVDSVIEQLTGKGLFERLENIKNHLYRIKENEVFTEAKDHCDEDKREGEILFGDDEIDIDKSLIIEGPYSQEPSGSINVGKRGPNRNIDYQNYKIEKISEKPKKGDLVDYKIEKKKMEPKKGDSVNYEIEKKKINKKSKQKTKKR